MKELGFSKQIRERTDCFPWLKIFLSKHVKKFPNDLDKELLQFLLQNVEKEVNSLANCEETKTKEVLFDTIYDLFLHFWWKIRWKGKKKWRKCWKIVSSEVPYAYDEHTKCCEKLLYNIIYLGITLSNGYVDSEWIGKVFKAIYILPSFDDMVYNSLLRVNHLKKKYRHVYIAVLKHVLCSEVAENISEPVTYVKIIMLFRRLKKYTEDKFTMSALKSTASSIKPPSDTMQWLSSLKVDIPLEKHINIATALLSDKSSNAVFRKLYQVITGSVNLEQKDEPLSDESEEMDKQSDVSHVKHHKHISHKLHPKAKLKESPVSLNTDTTAACSSPSLNSKIKIRLNHKMLAGFNIPQELNQTEILKKKENLPKNRNTISKKEFNEDPSIIKASNMNEFLNLSFAEISNFSKSVTPQPKKLKCATKCINVTEKDILTKKSDTSPPSTSISSSSNHKRKRKEFSNGSLRDKRIKINSKQGDCSTIPSAQEKYLRNHETSNSDEIACLNSLSTLNSNKLDNLPQERKSCSQKATDCIDQWFVPPSSYEQDYLDITNCNLFNEEAAATEVNCNTTQGKQISLNKTPLVSLVDIKNHQQSALLKLVQPLDVNLASSLLAEISPETPIENDTEQCKIDWNNSNKIMTTGESSDVIQGAERLKKHCQVSPSAPIENDVISFDIDWNKPNAAMSINESPGIIQETVKPKQHCDGSPSTHHQNDSSQIDSEISNSAIAISESSSPLCSTKNVNENIEKNCGRIANFTDNSLKLCNSLDRSSLWNENSLITKDPRSNKSQSLFPTTSKSLELIQSHSNDSIKHSSVNSETVRGSNLINQRNDDNIRITQNENTSNCVVDCKIINDNSCNNESTSSIKVIINVTCKTPEDSSNRQKEHIFGNFSGKSANDVTPNTSQNYFNSLNPFYSTSSTTEMPKLTPYYDDPPLRTRWIDTIATPPDSEMDISVPGSFKRDNVGAAMQLFTKKLSDKPKCTSTPKDVPIALPIKILTDKNSEFRTPDTSDCETSNEWSLENTNLTNSLLLINSLQNSPINNVLKRLHSRTVTPAKKESDSSATLQSCSNKIVSYRSNENIYSGDELSNDSTVSCPSPVSATDNELICAAKKPANPKKCKGILKQKPTKVFQKKGKKPLPKKSQSGGLQRDSSCNPTNRYYLRSREKLLKPSKLEDFLTSDD